jgi:uncharacterized membrane protein YbhN (UPF0104 family)
VAAEAASALTSVLAQGVILGIGSRLPPPGGARRGRGATGRGAGPSLRTLLTTALAATAIGYLVPGGPAVSAGYAARRFRKLGVPAAEAAQSQLATAGCAGVALGVLALGGLLVPGAAREAGLSDGPLLLARGAAVLTLVVSVALLLIMRTGRSRRGLGRSRIVGWVTGSAPAAKGSGQEPPVLGVGRLAGCCALSVVVVLFDLAVLVGALRATHVPVPWTSLLLAYGVTQLASLVPLTPGGVGLVEGGLGALLTASSAPDGAVALAVLLYRSISFGAVIAAGAIALAAQRRQDPALLAKAAGAGRV